MPLDTWNTFHLYVLPKTPGLTVALADVAIREAAREFCERTKIHKHTLSVAVGEDETVTPVPPAQTEIAHIMLGRIGQQEITPKDEDWLAREYGPDWMTSQGEPKHIVGDTEDTFRLVPYMGVANSMQLTLRVALRPSESATGLESWIARRHRMAIARGALKNIMGSPEMLPYSNPNQAAAHRAAFDAAITKAAKEATRGHTRAAVRTKPHYF